MAENIGLFKHVQVETDGITVWVNTERGCIARFGEYAYEIQSAHGRFASSYEMVALTPKELFHSPPPHPLIKLHWSAFVKKMKELYKFEVPEKYMPRRFRG
jgi:hypothetical protein